MKMKYEVGATHFGLPFAIVSLPVACSFPRFSCFALFMVKKKKRKNF